MMDSKEEEVDDDVRPLAMGQDCRQRIAVMVAVADMMLQWPLPWILPPSSNY